MSNSCDIREKRSALPVVFVRFTIWGENRRILDSQFQDRQEFLVCKGIVREGRKNKPLPKRETAVQYVIIESFISNGTLEKG